MWQVARNSRHLVYHIQRWEIVFKEGEDLYCIHYIAKADLTVWNFSLENFHKYGSVDGENGKAITVVQ